jgi:hypothetical protein
MPDALLAFPPALDYAGVAVFALTGALRRRGQSMIW